MEVDQEILVLLSRLGQHEPTEDNFEIFIPESHPVKTLKDIRRILNKDIEDEDDFSSRSLSDVHAARRHLVPLLLASAEHAQGDLIVDEVTKLFVLLTLPDTPFHSVHARELRLAFVENSRAGHSPLALLVGRVESALGTDASKRKEEDRKRVDLLLYLVRNLLLPTEKESDRGEFTLELEQEAVFEILLHFTNHVTRKSNREWNLLLLDIYFHLFRGILPESLLANEPSHADDTTPKANSENGGMGKALAELREQKRQSNKHVSSRHSNFGGVFQVIQDGAVKIVPNIYGSKRISGAPLPSSVVQRRRRVQDASVISRDVLSSSKSDGVLLSQGVFSVLSKVASELIDNKGYAQLFSSLIQDFRREDARIKLDDEIRFIWLIRFFSRYARERGDWEKTSLMTTMDLWSFQFIVTRVATALEQKAWASLETSIGALLEMVANLKMMTSDETAAKTMRNAVFYEVRERLEIVPRLIKLWEPAVLSRDCLKQLVLLADHILDILEDMADEGALAKAKTKARIKEERKQKNQGLVFNLKWSAEETFALSEGVKSKRGQYDLAAMREILKDPGVGPVFEDQKRTPQQLLARWIQIREALSNGKTLEHFVSEDLAKEVEEDKADDAQAEAETAIPTVHEKQVDFFSALRSYLSNNVYRNLTRLIDPAIHPDGDRAVLRDTQSQALVAKFFRRLRAFKKGLKSEESLEPVLWHVESLNTWQRFLHLASNSGVKLAAKETQDLVNVLLSSIRRMFRFSEQNKLVLLELLFWRTKHENIMMSRGYKSRISTSGKTAVNTEPSEFQMQHEDELNEMDRSSEEDDAGADDGEESFKGGDDDKDEEEIELKASSSASPKPSRIKEKAPKVPVVDKRKRKDEVKVRREKGKKNSSKKLRQPLPSIKTFHVDAVKAKRAVAAALASGVSSEAFMDLVNAFDDAESDAMEGLFVPRTLHATDKVFSQPGMLQVMVLLGMRPPNRDISTKSKSRFICETYWRLPTNRMTTRELRGSADLIRAAIVGDDDLVAAADDDSLPGVDWCVSDHESGKPGLTAEEESSEDDASSSSSGEEGEENSFADAQGRSMMSKQSKSLGRRVVMSSDEEEDNGANSDADDKQYVKETLDSIAQEESTAPKRRRMVVSDDDDD